MNYDRISTFREVCYKQKMKYKKKTLMKITLKKEIQFFYNNGQISFPRLK